MRRLAALVLVLVALLPAPVSAAPDFAATIDAIVARGDGLVDAYAPAAGTDTADAFSGLYFDDFEASGLEADIGARDSAAKIDIEGRFAKVIGQSMNGATPALVQAAWKELRTALELRKAGYAEAGSTSAAFIQSFLILIREGFEAILVISALAAYLRRSGNEDKMRYLHQGILWALVASGLTAWAMASLFTLTAIAREVVEGVTMLFAAGVLLYVSTWLFAKREAQKWQSYVKAQVDRAVSGGKAFALGLAVFLAVYREGAETVLFYQALAIGQPGHMPAQVAGFAAACVGLAVIYWLMRTASLKIPLKPFFAGTAVLLYALAVAFVGQGILELQEARWLPVTPLHGVPQVPLLGLFPTLETLGAQLLVLLPALVAGVVMVFNRRSTDAPQGTAR
ncbi:MAG TPA: FTR1 family protein [Azospirillaceae bacterium]|nr:FTR1 family protein [Azospirillaceae bacterium]